MIAKDFSTSKAPTILFIVAVSMLSISLRQTIPIYAIADAGYDDQLYVRMALNLLKGEWLGPYDHMVSAKGAGYAFFLAINHLLGLPLKLGEHLLYLASSLGFSLVLGRLTRSNIAVGACFAVLAFSPVSWIADSARVARENLYTPLTLLVFTSAAGAFLLSTTLRSRLMWLTGLGLAFAAFWLTREESPWIYPALAVFVGCWLLGRLQERRVHGVAAILRGLRGDLAQLLVSAAAFAVVVVSVAAMNASRYGVFMTAELRSPAFSAAYGAIMRIKHADWHRYIAFPHEARQRAYAVSPA
ncbi:MAG: hypothetical protein K2X44_08365, partial [Magnetospirillum sp.]|nr:hypothetical protein [Magnetospirillum sp.]